MKVIPFTSLMLVPEFYSIVGVYVTLDFGVTLFKELVMCEQKVWRLASGATIWAYRLAISAGTRRS